MTFSTKKISAKKGMRQKLVIAMIGVIIALTSFGVFFSSVSAQTSKKEERANCVKNQMREASWNPEYRGYNIMVFNTTDQPYDAGGLRGVKSEEYVRCAGKNYKVWVFKSGTFINQGDGGWINWAFMGNFKRTGSGGKTVIFD